MMKGRVKIIECVDREEIYGEFSRLIKQDIKNAESQEEKDALQNAIIRLQNILF